MLIDVHLFFMVKKKVEADGGWTPGELDMLIFRRETVYIANSTWKCHDFFGGNMPEPIIRYVVEACHKRCGVQAAGTR